MGARDRRGDPGRHPVDAPHVLGPPEAARRPPRGSAARPWSSTATTTASRRWPTDGDLVRGPRLPARHRDRRRPLRPGPAPGLVQPAAAPLRRGGGGLMRAREPDLVGDVDSDGVSIHYEVFGSGPDDRLPDADLPDRRQPDVEGAGALPGPALPGGHRRPARSRPLRPAAGPGGVRRRRLRRPTCSRFSTPPAPSRRSWSRCASATKWALMAAVRGPRTGPRTGLDRDRPRRPGARDLDRSRSSTTPRWVDDYPGWAEHHSEHMVPEPHSTKVYDDLVEWALETDAATLRARFASPKRLTEESEVVRAAEALTARCSPCTAREDDCQNPERGTRFAELVGGRLVVIEGAGHLPMARHPCSSTPRSRSSWTCTPQPSTVGDAVAVRPGAEAPSPVGLLADRARPRAAGPHDRPCPA